MFSDVFGLVTLYTFAMTSSSGTKMADRTNNATSLFVGGRGAGHPAHRPLLNHATFDLDAIGQQLTGSSGSNESLFLTPEEIEQISRDSAEENRNFDPVTESIIVVIFVLLIAVGTFGNSLVCYVVVRNAKMRTPRNIFIINLAISDLTLCLFTQPFNLVKVLMIDWRLGSFMCKLVPVCAGTNVFVSTISITAIALDRFQVIVYPTKDSMNTSRAVFVSLFFIWIVSILMAAPLMVFNQISPFELFPSFILYEVCVENAEMLVERRIYSIASVMLQYIAPVVIVTVAHAQISNKLKYRMINKDNNRAAASAPSGGVGCSSSGGGSSTQLHLQLGQQQQQLKSVFHVQKSKRDAKRKRKTNRLLTMIALVFAFSWMPLNVLNVMADFDFDLTKALNERVHGLAFPICHVLVLCSACVNPLLYGWLNENFRREFVKVLCNCPPGCRRRLCCCCGCCDRWTATAMEGTYVRSRNSITMDVTCKRHVTANLEQNEIEARDVAR